VYEVLRLLYGIPSSARALHFTLDKYMQSQGFVRSGFEESIWIREANDTCKHRILISAHIDDTLILCDDLATLQTFKQELLERFEGTDEGEVEEYLGCKLIRDRDAKTLKLVQGTYIRRILETHGMTDCHPVKTPLAPGVRLTLRDSPEGDGERRHHLESPGRPGGHQPFARLGGQRFRRRSRQPSIDDWFPSKLASRLRSRPGASDGDL